MTLGGQTSPPTEQIRPFPDDRRSRSALRRCARHGNRPTRSGPHRHLASGERLLNPAPPRPSDASVRPSYCRRDHGSTGGDMTDQTDIPFAVVTGASSGIGYELARQFAEHGFDLLVTSETKRIDDAAQRLRTLGAQVEAVQAN